LNANDKQNLISISKRIKVRKKNDLLTSISKENLCAYNHWTKRGWTTIL